MMYVNISSDSTKASNLKKIMSLVVVHVFQ